MRQVVCNVKKTLDLFALPFEGYSESGWKCGQQTHVGREIVLPEPFLSPSTIQRLTSIIWLPICLNITKCLSDLVLEEYRVYFQEAYESVKFLFPKCYVTLVWFQQDPTGAHIFSFYDKYCMFILRSPQLDAKWRSTYHSSGLFGEQLNY